MIDVADVHDGEKCADCLHPRFEHITADRITGADAVQRASVILGYCQIIETVYGWGQPEEGGRAPCRCYGFRESRPRTPAWRMTGRPYDPRRVRR